MTTRDAAEYSLKSGGRKIADGHKPARLRARHRAAHAELARLVTRGTDDAARTGAADDDRLAGELRPSTDLDRCEERVHVDVQDRAAGIVGAGSEVVRPLPAPGRFRDAATAHCVPRTRA